ncbi:hypothetical protein PV328_012429, partial [Microctonus aethiopoides]
MTLVFIICSHRFNIHGFLTSVFGYSAMNGDIDGRLNLNHYANVDDADDFHSSLADPEHLPK